MHALVFFYMLLALALIPSLSAVEASVIVASVEGEVLSISLEDEFQVTLDSSSVGKKIEEKSILVTKENGTTSLLFSNGALITIKPGSRFYLRKFSQKSFSPEHNSIPSELEIEPSQSELFAHLDFGNLIVKAPTLKKGSSMVLSSPLGTAEIRGTMFQMVAVRNPVTGDITGGVNLISGDISFTDLGGSDVNLASGQSLQLASGKLGESMATVPGGLVNLTATYGESLTGDRMPPSVDMLFPEINELGNEEFASFSASSTITPVLETDWEMVHEIASEIFFTIETSEANSANFSYEDISDAVAVSTPSPQVIPPQLPPFVTGGDLKTEILNPFVGAHPEVVLVGDDFMRIEMTPTAFAKFDPWIEAQDFTGTNISASVSLLNSPDLKTPGTYSIEYVVNDFRGLISRITRRVEVIATPPLLYLNEGIDGGDMKKGILHFQVFKKYASYPLSDNGSFQISLGDDLTYPFVTAKAYNGSNLTSMIEVINSEMVDPSILGQQTQISILVNDLSVRGIKLPSEQPVSTSITANVVIVDSQKPITSFAQGESRESPYQIEGNLNQDFVDPGINLIDNYYSQAEIENFMNFQTGAHQSAFGSVNLSVAGSYEITYQGISDPSRNVADPKTRYIEVFDSTGPEIFLYGTNPIYVDLNATTFFKDPGAFATDNLEQSIEWESGRFEMSLEKLIDENTQQYEEVTSSIEEIISVARTQSSLYSTFRLKYSIADLAGNKTHIYRQIILLNSPFKTPKIVLHGDNPYYHEVNTEFVDPGVTAYKDMGIGVEPRNLNHLVTSLSYKNGAIGFLDHSKVNYHFKNKIYVDQFGNEDSEGKIIIKYLVIDEFGNEASISREVRFVDRTPPSIVLLKGDQGVNFTNLQAGISFQDPGATVKDNYDLNVPLNTKIIDQSTGAELEPTELLSYGFVKVGNYEVQYSSIDSNDNNITSRRLIGVVDTIAPQIAIVSHGFLKGLETMETINPVGLGDKPIVDDKNPIPNEILSSLKISTGWNGSEFNSDYVITLESPSDFYVLTDPGRIKIAGHPNPTVVVKDELGRSKARFSAFYMEDNTTGEIIFEDPGIYVRNDTATGFSFKPSLTPVYSQAHNNKIVQFNVNYVVTQDSGESIYLNSGRKIYIIDKEKPFITIGPDTTTNLVVIEANRLGDSFDRYTDLAGNVVKLFNPTDSSYIENQKLVLSAFDANNGTITERIFRKIMDSSGKMIGQLYDNVNPLSVGTNIYGSVDATLLDAEYSIEYTVRDIPIDPSLPTNISDPVTRRMIVKDTKPPILNVSDSNSTFLVHYQSTVQPNVMDVESVKEFMLTGVLPYDANNYDQDFTYGSKTQSGDNKWDISIVPPFVPGAIFPQDRNRNIQNDAEQEGYKVTITLKDQSGNESNSLIRYLKVGDYEPPTLYLIGQSEIHDFLRFATNPLLSDEKVFPGRPISAETNSTGIASGEHRMLLADYNFVDPGVYAEDDNAYFDIKDNHPDLNGNGIGEGRAIVRVKNRFDMDSCTQGPGLIHVYSWFEKNSYTMKDWQDRLDSGNYGYNTNLLPTEANASGSPGKVPDVKGENVDGASDLAGQNWDDQNKSDLTNFDMTIITIEYRVMDGWENLSRVVTRTVYIYESRQYDGYAFYATPVLDASAAPFEDFYDNDTGNPFLTAVRKDLDGDGVSDFWEYALGTDYRDRLDSPDMSDPAVFQSLSALSVPDLTARLSKMNGASELKTVYGMTDFNATSDL